MVSQRYTFGLPERRAVLNAVEKSRLLVTSDKPKVGYAKRSDKH